jgi:hypothetical protein
MKEKILNALKTKYKNLGLSDKAFDGVAEFYSKTITEESKIEEAVEGAESILKSMQSEADRVRTGSQSEKEELEQKVKALELELEKKKDPSGKPPEGGAKGEENAEIEALKKRLDDLVGKQDEANKAISDKNLLENAKKKMIEKGVEEKLCDKILKNYSISETDTVDSISEYGINEFNDLKQIITPEAPKPQSVLGGGGETEMDDYFAQKKAENESKTKNLEELKTS